MKKKSAPKQKNSLKILIIFIICVSILMFISLTIRTILMIHVSKFQGSHSFSLAIEKQSHVEEIISFDPTADQSTVLQIKNPQNLNDVDLGREFGVIPDERVAVPQDSSIVPDPSTEMNNLFWHINQIKTNITLYDILRLLLFAKSVPLANKRFEVISLPINANDIDKLVSGTLSDNTLAQENISVQVINASGKAGMANRLARVITNLGGDVVSVITAQSVQDHSQIKYFGKQTYTLQKLSYLLKYPESTLDSETIADIVIIIGKDSENTTLY